MTHDIEKIRKANKWTIKHTVDDYAESMRQFFKTKGELYTYSLMLEQMQNVKESLIPVLGELNLPHACDGLEWAVNTAKRELVWSAESLIAKAQRMEEIGFSVDANIIAEAKEILANA